MLRVPGCQKSVRPQNNTTSVDSHKMEVVEMYQYMYIYIYTNARVWQTSICDDLPLLYTTIYTILIYSSIKICSSCIASIQSNNQLYRSSLPSPHVFPIARSPELIVVIPKTSNTSCSVRETFDILFIGDMNFIAVGPEQHGQGQGVPV